MREEGNPKLRTEKCVFPVVEEKYVISIEPHSDSGARKNSPHLVDEGEATRGG